LLLVYAGDSFPEKPPGTSNGPEAFVDRETNSITFGVGEVTGLIDPQKIDVSQQEANKKETTPENDVPVLDLKHAETTGSDQLKGRKRRNSLRQDRKIVELPASVEPLPLSSHAWIRLPALPVEQSNVIILGKVTDRRAVLTDDRLGVYSEFSITSVKSLRMT
jgi:hypothetical protein